jgi:hypothetical protein
VTGGHHVTKCYMKLKFQIRDNCMTFHSDAGAVTTFALIKQHNNMIDGHGVGNINKNVRDRRSLGITGTLCGQGRCGALSDTASLKQRLLQQSPSTAQSTVRNSVRMKTYGTKYPQTCSIKASPSLQQTVEAYRVVSC